MIAETLRIDKRKLKPDSLLRELLPLESRRDLWASISERLALNLPELWRGPGWDRVLFAIPVLSLVVPLALAAMHFLETVKFFAIAALGIFVTWVLAKVTQQLKKYFHPKSLTLDALTKNMMALNVGSLSAGEEGLNKNDVYIVLLEIIADNTGLSVEEIKPHHAFIDDLNMD